MTREPFNPFFLPTGPRLPDVKPIFKEDDEHLLLGDTFPFFHRGVWHVFTCHPPVILHYSTADMVHWREHPLVVRQGPTAADDKHWCATGTILEHESRFYCFYTGNQNVCLALSDDLDHWTKHPDNPIVVGDDVTYNSQYFRDPYVFFHRGENLWWMLLGSQTMTKPPTRAGCVGLAKSADLIHWQLHPPLWRPLIGLSCDCPQIVEHAGLWYLLYLNRNCRYRVADSPQGPFRRPTTRNLGTSWAITLSRPYFDGRRWIAWPFVCRNQGHADLGAWDYAGELGIARQYEFANEMIAERPADEILQAMRDLPDLAPAALATAQTIVGEWKIGDATLFSAQPGQSHAADGGGNRVASPIFSRDDAGGTLLLADVPADFYLETDVHFSRTDMDAHLLLRVDRELTSGYQIILHPRTAQVTVRGVSLADVDRVMVYRFANLEAGRPNKLRVFLCGSILEVFVNDRLSLTARVYQHRQGLLGLEFRDGPGLFDNLSIRPLKA